MTGADAVRLHQASKCYRFYRRPGDRLREWLTKKNLHQTHWALHSVDLNVARGETFGIVGENGAGKSTLLKLVAGTSRPTNGEVELEGRVAALLELGAGFHPEQNGRDNIYLMGALNGIGAAQMSRYYADIAAFSELSDEVLERPVKTYSSGMFMRLAFATATAIDPDVLIIDEALSVGDMRFQKKSLDRIMRIRERGKTVLFCSHNMYQIRSLCQRAAWLHEGKVQALGDTENVVTAFESHLREKEQIRFERPEAFASRQPATALPPVGISSVLLLGNDGLPVDTVESFQRVSVLVESESRDPGIPFNVGVAIVRNDKENVFGTSTHFDAGGGPFSGSGTHRAQLEFPSLPLLSGDYWLSVYTLDDSGLQVYDMAESVCPFTVRNPGREFGLVHLPHRWSH